MNIFLLSNFITPYNTNYKTKQHGRQKVLLVCMLLIATVSYGQTIRYVKPATTGNGTGSSWANASADLQDMINVSSPGDQIWVAGGTYKPNRRADAVAVITPNDRNNAYVLKEGVKIYGGFDGTEIALTQRDLSITANASILSGDFNGDDINFTNNNENATHVVVSAGNVGTAELNGFIVKCGFANSYSFVTVNSQSVYNADGAGIVNHNSSPTLNYIKILGNKAAGNGGGISNNNSSPYIANTVITGNISENFGAGIINNSNSSPTMINCLISFNQTNSATFGNGAGICNISSSSPVISDSSVNNNTSAKNGGGIFNSDSLPIITNSFFNLNNAAESGGGMYNVNSSVQLNNIEFNNNSATLSGGGVSNSYGLMVMSDVIFSENTAGTWGGGMISEHSSSIAYNAKFVSNIAGNSGGGILNAASSTQILTNVIFISNNAAINGGGIDNTYGTQTLTNVTFANNNAGTWGGAIHNGAASSKLRNCIIYGNTASQGNNIFNIYDGTANSIPQYYNSLVQGTNAGWGNFGTDGGGNIDADPLFTNPTENIYTLTAASPAINTGSNSFYATGMVPDLSAAITDLAGNARITGTTIDMGAYEFIPCTTSAPTASPQTFCNMASVSNLTAMGDGLLWYDTQTGGTPLTTQTAIESAVYYVSQTLNGCESVRVPVGVTVNHTPQPQGDTTQVITVDTGDDATLGSIEITGEAIAWYITEADALNGGMPLSANTVVISGTTYYATQTINECTSATVLPVTVTVALGINTFEKKYFTYYPNPVTNELTVATSVPVTGIGVYTPIGQLLLQKEGTSTMEKIDLTFLETGTYLLRVTFGNIIKNAILIKK